MAYLHIDNLYKNKDILLFKECYALEKIHGTSAHIRWADNVVNFFAGGCKHETFVGLFNTEELTTKFTEIEHNTVIVYGEAYGGSIQKMRDTYGDKIKFVAFEVKIDDSWLCVPDASDVVQHLGLDFVSYRLVPTILRQLDKERDYQSVQAIKNGCGEGKMREGIVLRPPIEVVKNNGKRIIAKYKRDDFRETSTPRKVNENKLKIIEEADAVAREWVTEMRLTHVLDKFPQQDITVTGEVIKSMVEDIIREAKDEIVLSRETIKQISRRTALMYKSRLKNDFQEEVV
jgi:hypothetical protein